MQLLVLVALVALIIFFLRAGIALPAIILFLVLIADILGGYVSAFLTLIWDLLFGIVDTGRQEFDELEKTSTKAPHGKKFLEEGLMRTGKALGKGEAAKAQGKQITEKRPDTEVVHTAVSDFMNGLWKILKK